eukprot:TRINITY_DN11381_c0_g2_i2.p1 TRINITY_DN11381_c0_g2~~TRINITY_DN11381_c0_g2_i2.p1  ORF type:complete len:161 (-),score=21.57 TRINITY_DN11381_c0_g2_i2:206-625(-)
MAKKNGGDANIKQLFHGTSSTHPGEIYQGNFGFDFRLSQVGMWGRGSYFATNAAYSHDYYHTSSNGSSWMFLADVILGDVCHCAPDSSLRMPPIKQNAAHSSSKPEHYDSVSGWANNSLNYVVYEHQRSYPKYLIEYSL